jgi:hypothetical protein
VPDGDHRGGGAQRAQAMQIVVPTALGAKPAAAFDRAIPSAPPRSLTEQTFG